MPPYAYRVYYRISHGGARAVPRKPAIHPEMSARKTRHAMKSERNNRPWLLAAAPVCSRQKIAIQNSPHAYAGFSELLSVDRAIKRRRGYFFLRFADFERFDFWRCVA